MRSIGINQCIDILCNLADTIESKKDFFTELDSAIGDGDFGVSISLGFHAIKNSSSSFVGKNIAEILEECSIRFSDNAPSTIGILLSTGFLCASSIMVGKDEIGSLELSTMLKAAIEGIQKRGKADLGDKTILDALTPAWIVASNMNEMNADIDVLLNQIASAAEKGAEATRKLKAHKGRSRWLQERSIGHLDPGAVAVAIILRICSNYLNEANKIDYIWE